MQKRKGEAVVDSEESFGSNRESHPSYGLISVTRTHGGMSQLFGSPVEHASRVSLVIRRSSVTRDLCRDWLYGHEELIRIDMSSAQFAELLTSMNQGDGVPCTIRSVAGTDMPPCPSGKDHREKVEDDFAATMRKASAAFAESAAALEDILGQKTLKQKDRDQIRAIIANAQRLFVDKLTFAQSSFAEATEATLQAARKEMDGFVSDLVRRAGVQSMAEITGLPRYPALEDRGQPVPATPESPDAGSASP